MQTISSQPALFDCSPTIVQRRMILNVSYDQTEILYSIASLHNGGLPFELDPTYSTGQFYERFPKPRLRFDLAPQMEGVEQADARCLPLADEKVGSMILDPPFIVSGGKGGVIHERFSSFKSYPLLEEMYRGAIQEGYRVLRRNGLLVVKCQDTVSGGRNHQTTKRVCDWAEEAGLVWKDTFYLINDRLTKDNRWKNQHHGRKAVSLFLCFLKKGTK